MICPVSFLCLEYRLEIKKKKKVFQEYQDAQQPVMSLNLLMKPTRWEKRPSWSITLDQSYYTYATS